jgi:hypothetical protein
MKGQTIIVTGFPKGARDEGILALNAYPGTKMEIKNGVLPIGGRHTWQPYGTNAGMSTNDPRACAILLADDLQGSAPLTQLLAANNRAFLYFPLPGEDMNILLAGQAGTGSTNAFTIGERLSPQVSATPALTGLYILQGTSASNAEFISKEHIDEIADQTILCWAQKQ